MSVSLLDAARFTDPTEGQALGSYNGSFVQELVAFVQDRNIQLLYSGAMRTYDDSAPHLPTILIVDDDGPTLELYANALSQQYQVLTCSNQQDALDLLSTRSLQLIVLEPSIEGYQGWQLLQELNRTHAIPVIICSVLDNRKHGLEAGAAAYLVKPVLPTTLSEVLKRILNRSN